MSLSGVEYLSLVAWLANRSVTGECNVVYGRQDIGEGWVVSETSQSLFRYASVVSD